MAVCLKNGDERGLRDGKDLKVMSPKELRDRRKATLEKLTSSFRAMSDVDRKIAALLFDRRRAFAAAEDAAKADIFDIGSVLGANPESLASEFAERGFRSASVRRAVANLRKAFFRDDEPLFRSLSCVGIRDRDGDSVTFYFHREKDPPDLFACLTLQYRFSDYAECVSAETVKGGCCVSGICGDDEVYFGYTYDFDQVADDVACWLAASSEENRKDPKWIVELDDRVDAEHKNRMLRLEAGGTVAEKKMLLELIYDLMESYGPHGVGLLERGTVCNGDNYYRLYRRSCIDNCYDEFER